MFHAKGGLFFERTDAGNVVVKLHERASLDSELIRSFVLDKDTWASVVASVSALGDEARVHELASKLHAYGDW